MSTIWKSLICMNYPSYEVSDGGVVCSVERDLWMVRYGEPYYTKRKRRELKPRIIRGGYAVVRLYRDGDGVDFIVHRLVLTAFVGPCPNGMECCHNDGDPSNNRLENLRWATPKENGEDKVRHGTTTLGRRGRHYNQGSKSAGAKITEDDVREMRRLHALGVGSSELGRRFGISSSNASHIVLGTAWRHVV